MRASALAVLAAFLAACTNSHTLLRGELNRFDGYTPDAPGKAIPRPGEAPRELPPGHLELREESAAEFHYDPKLSGFAHVFTPGDTLHLYDAGDALLGEGHVQAAKIDDGKITLRLDDEKPVAFRLDEVAQAKVSEFSPSKTVLLAIGITLGVAALLAVSYAAAWNHCENTRPNCP